MQEKVLDIMKNQLAFSEYNFYTAKYSAPVLRVCLEHLN